MAASGKTLMSNCAKVDYAKLAFSCPHYDVKKACSKMEVGQILIKRQEVRQS